MQQTIKQEKGCKKKTQLILPEVIAKGKRLQEKDSINSP
jgi:hypothetical protein